MNNTETNSHTLVRTWRNHYKWFFSVGGGMEHWRMQPTKVQAKRNRSFPWGEVWKAVYLAMNRTQREQKSVEGAWRDIANCRCRSSNTGWMNGERSWLSSSQDKGAMRINRTSMHQVQNVAFQRAGRLSGRHIQWWKICGTNSRHYMS